MKQLLFTFAGKKHRYIRSKKLSNLYGYHIQADDDRPGIVAVEKKLTGRMELDTNIHEMLHACAPFSNEEWVLQTARDIAKALWELGYRKTNELSQDKKGKKIRRQ